MSRTLGTEPRLLEQLALLEQSPVDEIRAVPNVAVVVPEVQMLFDPDDSGAGFGLPDFIVGSVTGADEGRETFELKAAQGRLLSAGDEGSDVVVTGSRHGPQVRQAGR